MEEILSKLYELQDKKYGEFQAKLIPNISADAIIGVRTPELKKYAKNLYAAEDKKETVIKFLSALPHRYFDENQLHAFIISLEKDYDKCMGYVEAFLPYIDNWATCDQLSPKIFKKHKNKLMEKIKSWIKSDETYTVRFAAGMLMQHYLDEDFRLEYADMVAEVESDEYYINMMRAWYFATALAKQYDAVIPYIEGKCLDKWTHNKAIQKSVESYRITDEEKAYLKTLKIKP
ncbi:MAG: DNA alkylation repair protein [Lachnospiraceae bacterium]|nr:DNA alkylation repair protein [Lachnospiraceae bacterium]